ncbi:MAG: tol-pal system protein YbgF, partial [Thermodesulfobacterium sp.]|nr:tol-pal system protein YbgF [Thermodesulfobacterium sp.]
EVPKNLKEEDLFQQAYLYFQKGDYRLARSYWEEYLKRYPKGRWVGQTYYWLGETYFKEKNYEEAIIYYQKLIDLPEPNPFKPKAMLKQAEAFLQLKDKKAAEVVLKKLVKTFPGTQEAKEGEKILKGLK